MLPMRLYEGDLGFIMKKLDIFENKMDTIGTAVTAMMGELRSSCTLSPDWPTMRSNSTVEHREYPHKPYIARIYRARQKK